MKDDVRSHGLLGLDHLARRDYRIRCKGGCKMKKEEIMMMFEDLENIGKGEKGITRLAYSAKEMWKP